MDGEEGVFRIVRTAQERLQLDLVEGGDDGVDFGAHFAEGGVVVFLDRHLHEQVEVGDARLYDFRKSDLIVSYYCMQFIQPRFRQDVYDRLYERLNWGGALILFEKVRAPDARFQDMLVSLYNDYKRGEGFTADEILNKTASLKSVLEPFSTEANLGLLRRAGFVDVMTVMKYLCFEGFLAIK